MFKIQDQISVGLKINGVEYPLEAASFERIQVFNTVSTFLPTINIILSDQHNLFVNNITLGDGALLELSLGINQMNTYRFRVFNYKMPPSNGVTMVKIVGYLDVPRLLFDAAVRSYRGTSDSVLRSIATELGLGYKGTPTNDSQTWIPQNEKLSKFLHSVVRHGYINDRSCMQWFIDPSGTMHYVDVNNLKYQDTSSPIPVLITGQPSKAGEYRVVDMTPNNKAGMFNTIGGYAKTMIEQGVNIDDSKQSKVKLTRIANTLLQSTDIKKGLLAAALQFMPINSGNVHDNYAKAEYQNMRISQLFNMSVSALVDSHTGISLLNPISFKGQTVAGNSQPQYNQTISGSYFVSCKTIHLTPYVYMEKFELLRDGIDADPSGTKSQV